MRDRINRDDRLISRPQCASSTLTWSTPPASRRTFVTRATAGPTAERQANSIFSGQSGASRSTCARTAGMTRSARITLISVARRASNC